MTRKEKLRRVKRVARAIQRAGIAHWGRFERAVPPLTETIRSPLLNDVKSCRLPNQRRRKAK